MRGIHVGNKYPVNLEALCDNEVELMGNIFKDVGARNAFRLDQEGEDLFRLKCREIADEVAKHIINQERNRHGI